MSKTLAENLTSLIAIKTAFRTKIQEKGLIIQPGTPFASYPPLIDELVEIIDLPREEYYDIFDLMWYCTEMKDCPDPEGEMDEINYYFERILGPEV